MTEKQQTYNRVTTTSSTDNSDQQQLAKETSPIKQSVPKNAPVKAYRTSWSALPTCPLSDERAASQIVQSLCERSILQVQRLASMAFRQYRTGKIVAGGKNGSIALQRATKTSENLAHSYMYILANACEATMKTVDKIIQFKSLLLKEFSNAAPSFLFFNETQKHVLSAMARKFDVDERWMARLIRGFRKKMDQTLPFPETYT
ncbi:MAG: hypothetical protein P1Q69_15800, partial [Candidatus Thorarchaeota archaeon]|nr:hypothetical protein [Candidatus Thorarchaeota archaeon]